MSVHATPRQTIKALLQGELPSCPFVMPIMFSIGARLANLPLRDFQSSPTKIANTLRQIRSVLKIDGLTCYFDPYLEVEALGCPRKWEGNGPQQIECPSFSGVEDLCQKLNSPDSLSEKGRMPVACEVLRRLKVMLKDEPALMVSVTGPFTIAARLSGSKVGAGGAAPPHDLVEYAAEVTSSVSKDFLEAGADVILLVENLLPELSPQLFLWWASLLEPIFNVIRFYEALPVLLLSAPGSEKNGRLIFSHNWDCVLCVPLADCVGLERATSSSLLGMGIALTTAIFGGDQGEKQDLDHGMERLRPDQKIVLLTSAEDIPDNVDLKVVAHTLERLRQRLSIAASN